MKLGRLALGAAGLLLLVLIVFAMLDEPVSLDLRGAELEDMVFVAGGAFRVGATLQTVEAFYVDRFEVTEREWARFRKATGRGPLPYWKGLRRDPDDPVRYVNLQDAKDFAHWKGKELPTNLQWERASQGEGGKRFPWGDGFLLAANTAELWEGQVESWGVTRVGTFERGRSAVGAYDMIGNVWEWTRSRTDERLHVTGRVEEGQGDRFIIRGGAFDTPIRGRADLEEAVPARTRRWDLGFRCVIAEAAYRRQERIFAALRELGYRHGWLHGLALKAAERDLVDEGEAALPYLEQAKQRAGNHPWLQERIQRIIERIHGGS
ncbi:MAG TPA: hypothetical protein ENK43_08170 [Planctomycetes bacterium]|nr:hypothetical protein [Planctomycetota bacterium]